MSWPIFFGHDGVDGGVGKTADAIVPRRRGGLHHEGHGRIDDETPALAEVDGPYRLERPQALDPAVAKEADVRLIRQRDVAQAAQRIRSEIGEIRDRWLRLRLDASRHREANAPHQSEARRTHCGAV
jgi:hypothetical protein